jgi:hypothetical protein
MGIGWNGHITPRNLWLVSRPAPQGPSLHSPTSARNDEVFEALSLHTLTHMMISSTIVTSITIDRYDMILRAAFATINGQAPANHIDSARCRPMLPSD